MAKPSTKTGAGAIADIWKDARKNHDELAQRNYDDPDPNFARGDIKPGQWEGAPHNAMPPNCPVDVVGLDAEGKVWCITATGDLRMIEKWDMATIANLFSPYINYAFWAWPAFGKVKVTDPDTKEVYERLEVKRCERDKLFTCLANEAAKRPMFDPSKQHRGRGGWTNNSNEFFWHSGKHMWKMRGRDAVAVAPALHDGYLYTRQPLTIEPWLGHVSAKESPAQRILEDLRTWNWERPYLDPVLVLGFIVTCFMGGALKARPIIFTTGGAGVGKSTLHDLLKHVLENVVFSTVDTTAAGIYQRMKHDALPVMVDELESKAGSTKAQAVIDIARVAYSGGDIARGGADHEGTTFKMYSSFFFSAINRPPMTTADKTRMAVLNLSKVDVKLGAGRHMLVKNETDGRMLLRQVMDGWGEFSKRLQPQWWDLLAEQKLDSRAIDTYGTLLAAANLVVGPDTLEAVGLPLSDAARLGEIIAEATRADRADHLDNWHKCLNRLLSSTIDAWRDGARPTVGGTMESLMNGALEVDLNWAKPRLQLVDLGARAKGELGDPGGGPYLAVPADGPNLQKLFAGSEWHQGVWYDALKQGISTKCVIMHREKSVMKINGSAFRCLLIDMTAFQKYAEKQ